MRKTENDILDFISKISTPGYFITAEFVKSGNYMPVNLECFIFNKLKLIREGASGRKYAFTENEWRIVLTYFPTDKVVEDKYALKNKVVKKFK